LSTNFYLSGMKAHHIAEMRAFNRFYTGIIGVLDEYILNSQFTLPEVRVLYELYHHESMSASDIILLLHIDKGYLSRLLKLFEKKKLIRRKPSKEDARSSHVELSALGRKEFEKLNRESDTRIATILDQLSARECEELLKYMNAVKNILTKVTL
jgi:DNA-binding MarR family transcriptional regulator